MILLYNSQVSGNCYKVRLLLAHLGIHYDRHEMDVRDRSNRAETLGHLNPQMRVPTIVLDDGRAIGESGAILWYFGEATRFVPQDRYDRARMLQWMFFEQYEHEPAIAVARFWLSYSGRADEMRDQMPQLHEKGSSALQKMEAHLADRDWFVGDSMSLADIALYAYTHVADEGGFDLAPFPAIRAWLGRVASQPGHVPMDA